MTVFSAPNYDGHEHVVFGHDAETGLRAIIAVHNTRLGPAVGGCRMWPYADDEAALRDALRLSRGMTYKSALAGLPFGGGKSVIIGDAKSEKSPELMQAMGRFVESLNGLYVAAEDVGMTVADMDEMATSPAPARPAETPPPTQPKVFCEGSKRALNTSCSAMTGSRAPRSPSSVSERSGPALRANCMKRA